MTKHYTREEFVDYVKNLKFTELEDVASFVDEYFQHFESIPEEQADEKTLAWEKYIILLSKYGHWFVSFALMVMEMRKEMEKAIPDGQVS